MACGISATWSTTFSRFTTQGAQHASSNPLGVNFAGDWWLGAALVAVLAHVYIFYG